MDQHGSNKKADRSYGTANLLGSFLLGIANPSSASLLGRRAETTRNRMELNKRHLPQQERKAEMQTSSVYYDIKCMTIDLRLADLIYLDRKEDKL